MKFLARRWRQHDRTQELARSLGAKVTYRPFTNHADQKNFAASLASHDWIFLLDADEELSPELKALPFASGRNNLPNSLLTKWRA